MLEPVGTPRFKLAGDKLTVFSGDDNQSLLLPADRMAPLRALKHRGIIQMV